MHRFLQIFILCTLSSSLFSQNVDFERPEGWAMAFTTASSLNLGQSTPRNIVPGELIFSAELSSIPSLSKEQQKVGFNGLKDEDLNKSPIFGRVRISYGLPWDTTAEISWTPPFEIDGAKPENLWGLAFSRPLIQQEKIDLGIRIFMTRGDVKADVTCSEEMVAIEPYTPGNLSGCVGISRDVLTVDHHGLEAALTFNSIGKKITPWLSFAFTRMEPSVRVDAPLQYGQEIVDIYSQGTTQTLSLGLSYDFNESHVFNLATSYTPLDANRPVSYGDRDSFWNFKLGYSFSF